MCTIFPVTTLIPYPSFLGTSAFIPALSSIVLNGDNIALDNISSPIFSSFIFSAAFNKATPPPATIPSFIAALVAHIASSTLSVFSFSSISELAPTLIIATLADNLANLCSYPITSWGFNFLDS